MVAMNDDLAAAIEEFDRVILERDVPAAAVVLDHDYALVLCVPGPAVIPRERWLEVLPDYVVHDQRVEHQHVDVRGDAASVLSLVHQQATVLGQDRSGVFVISDFWRRGPEGWRVWRRHSTPRTAGAMPGT